MQVILWSTQRGAVLPHCIGDMVQLSNNLVLVCRLKLPCLPCVETTSACTGGGYIGRQPVIPTHPSAHHTDEPQQGKTAACDSSILCLG